jgi:hypothetical protein
LNSGKSILLEFFKVVGIALITLFISSWFNGSKDIEYTSKSINSYFNVPDALEDKLKIMNGSTEIENISVVNFALHNRSFSDYEKVKVDIKIKGDNPPKILSSSMLPPKRLTNSGIAEIIGLNKELVGYSIDVFKTSIDDDYYLLHLIFEGKEAPEVKISTSTKNIEIKEYKQWKDWVWALFIVFVGYAVVLIPIAILSQYSTKRSKNRYLIALTKRWSENDILNDAQLKHVTKSFVEERDRKTDGFFKKNFKKLTSTT